MKPISSMWADSIRRGPRARRGGRPAPERVDRDLVGDRLQLAAGDLADALLPPGAPGVSHSSASSSRFTGGGTVSRRWCAGCAGRARKRALGMRVVLLCPDARASHQEAAMKTLLK